MANQNKAADIVGMLAANRSKLLRLFADFKPDKWVIIEDVEKEPPEESLDNSCLLAVDFAANVVAKGTIMKYSASDENIQVMMETILQEEALLPIPLEDDFIMKVKDALGHILSWPRHLVIRCSDLILVLDTLFHSQHMGTNSISMASDFITYTFLNHNKSAFQYAHLGKVVAKPLKKHAPLVKKHATHVKEEI
uniref:DUF8039 domain-containing protein n=1 Tax=Lactuca sativa TaxID=4236 RepID=A0A9R1VBC9_LACSA|nr:hypothetical protein LSAT_V11C500251850 [Lactuca sativa]